MKKISKIVCSALILCGAFCVPTMNAYATGDILIDEPMDFEEEAVTTVVTSEVIESAEIPVISDSQIIGYINFDTDTPAENTEETGVTSEITIVEESEAPTIPSGNATVIEDVNASVVDRQFLTIQSKNGNTFYLVVDKDSKGNENVYFMNLVDEYDLMAFAKDIPENVQAAMDAENGNEPTEPATDENGNPIETPTDENGEPVENKADEKTDSSGGGNGLLIIVGVLALGGGGAFYYFKVYKNKPKTPKQSDYSDEEDEDEYEEEQTVNEDDVADEDSEE